MRLFIHKVFNWEYWPFQILYIPIYFLWAYYALRVKTIFFFNAANPNIKNGGFIMDSKIDIYDSIPQKFYPITKLIEENNTFDHVLEVLEQSKLNFPFIVKPDIGLRGSAVKRINNLEELKKYHDKANFDYLLQDLIPFDNEVGIFYVRFPHNKKGKITGIVAKEFLTVKGDGQSTIEELIKVNPRYEFQLKSLEKEYGEKLQKVLMKDEKLNLVPYGNHARGAKFLDYSHLISPKLTEVINEMCLQIPEFYFGRLDIMFNSWEEFEQGKNFSIVELNGAASEPTHIYDPKHSLFFAWRELARHISYMFQISLENHQRGFPYLSNKEGIEQYKLHLKQSKKIINI